MASAVFARPCVLSSHCSSRSAGDLSPPTCSYSRIAPRRISPATPGASQAHATRSVAAHAGERVEIVRDIMTSGALYSCQPEDAVDSALELLVRHRITGLPVVNTQGIVVGVVSDFDLLALDSLGRTNTADLFPTAEQTWQAFKEVKSMLAKSAGKKVKDVMTQHPITVRPETGINDATGILLQKKIRRLPVVDGEGKLVGVLSRGNIVKAALAARKQPGPALNSM